MHLSVSVSKTDVSLNLMMLANEDSVKVCFFTVGWFWQGHGAAVRGMMFGF